MPLRTTSSPILTARKGGVPTADLLAQLRRKDPLAAEVIGALANEVNYIGNALRSPAPSLEDITVTAPDGRPIARIGSWVDGDQLRSGFWSREFYQAGDGPDTAVLYSDEDGQLIIGKNGSARVLDPFGQSAAWLGTEWDALDVTGAADNGTGLIRLTVAGHPFITGDELLVAEVGGVPNATGVWTVTVADANHIDLNESGFAGLYTSGGWVSRLLHVTGAVDNGAGLIRLTVTAHTYESGDKANVQNVGGVPAATGQWTVTVVDANTLDLDGSAFAGAYTSGGTCVRYFAGGLFQNVAVGPSFDDYRLRAFPDGTLRIRNAEIALTQTGAGIVTLDPAGPEIVTTELPSGDAITRMGRWYKGAGDPLDPANYWVGLYARRAWFGGSGPGDAQVVIDGPSITIKDLDIAPPPLPISVTFTAPLGERYLDSVNLTHLYLYPSVTLPPDHGAAGITWWLSRDNGVTWSWLGESWISEVQAGTARYDVLAPQADEAWRLKGATWDVSRNVIDDAVVSGPVTVAGLSAVLADGATSITAASASYTVDFPKCPWAFYPTVVWTNPTDVNFFHPRLMVKLFNAAGELSSDPKYAGAGQQVTQASYGAGAVQTYFEPYGWTLPPKTEPANGFRRFRFYLYAVNRAGDETLCNCWAGGASYGELIIAENRQADPSVVGAGLTVTSDGGIKLGTTNIANALMNPGFEDSLVHWETFGTGPTPVIESSGAYTGSKCLKMDSTSGAVYVQQGPISCRPGDLWYTEAYVKGAAILALVIDFYSASGWLDQSATVITPSGTWSPVQLAAKAAPTGTSSIRVLVLVYAGGGVAYLDNVYLSKVKNAEEINFNGTELRINPTTHALEIKGVDLSKSIAASVGAALAVSSGVLGVAPSGITESLVAQYAIANTHLKRVGVDKIAIVDADIVNLAAAKITAGTFAAGVAYVGDLSANQMKTGTLAANIAVLGAVAVSQLTAGTINASITMTAPTIISTVGSDTASLANGLIESTSASYRAKIQSGQLTLSAIAGGQPLAQHQNAYSGWMDGFGFTVVSCSSSTGVRVNGPAGANRISLTADAANFTSCPIRINGVDAINANGQFVGAGVNCPSYGVAAAGFNPNVGGLQYYGRSGTFYDRDGNAMVFRNGVLTTA